MTIEFLCNLGISIGIIGIAFVAIFSIWYYNHLKRLPPDLLKNLVQSCDSEKALPCDSDKSLTNYWKHLKITNMSQSF